MAYQINLNKAIICGNASFYIPHHTIQKTGELFYESSVIVQRSNRKYDAIPIMLSEKLLTNEVQQASMIYVKGKVKSFNDDDGSVKLFILASEIRKANDVFKNKINLSGVICKKGVYKKFDNGSTLYNFIICSKGYFNKKDYVPIIVWNEEANYLKDVEVSSYVNITGQFQCRQYDNDKKSYEIRAYEIKEVKKFEK